MAKINQTGRSEYGDAKHIRVYKWEFDSDAYRALSCYARCLLHEIRMRHTGTNNGHIPLSVREASDLLGSSINTARKAFKELQEKGFIRCNVKGAFTVKNRQASTWILTNESFGNHLPTKEYMSWEPPSEFKKQYQKVIPSVSRDDTVH